ncbi:DUF4382 domain-containing protein [Candidatus Latescibacterota bacterium]
MRHTRLLLLFTLSLLLIASCNFGDIFSSNDSDDDKTTEPQTGTLKMLLTDAPAEFEEVNITFSEIAVHFADGEDDSQDVGDDTEPADDDSTAAKIAESWIVINGEEQTFNLLELSNGVTALLGEQELEAGKYTQIRIVITDAEVVIDPTTSHPLTIPSGTLKFVRGFDIVAGEETELIVDFDAARSVHTTGNGNNESYKLIPTIRLINKAECGSITGKVTNYENLPVAYAIVGTDTVTSSYVNEDNGKFTLGFLAAGTYEILIVDELGQTYSAPGTSVTVGSKTDLGDITLE